MTSAMAVTARLPPQRSKSMRGRDDNHRRFEVPATNGSRPITGGQLCGGKVSELFHTREWICRRSNRCREALDRLPLFGWLLSQRDPIELSCEGVMRRSQVCKHQVCDYCFGRFGMVTISDDQARAKPYKTSGRRFAAAENSDRATMQMPQDLDTPHSGELFPVNE